jgi:hypothetical protein
MVTRSFSPDTEKFILGRISSRIKYSQSKRSDRIKQWQDAENKTLAYIPESDDDAIRRNARDNTGAQTYTTLQIPYSYATLMTAHTYMTSVFFSRSPVHQFSGRHGETEQQVAAVEALMSYQVETGAHLVPYYIWLYDAGKYGTAILEEFWTEEETQYSSVQMMEILGPDGQPIPGSGKKVQTTRRGAGFVGNKVMNVSPFDFGHDPHFPIYRFQEGEYCWVRKTLSWSQVVRRSYQGYYLKDNLKKVPNKTANPSMTDQGSSALPRPDRVGVQPQSDATGDEEMKHPTSLDVFEFHIELIQKEWHLGDSEYPEKWVFTLSSDYSVLLGAEPAGNAHGKFPFNVISTEIEGYGLYARGIPEIIDPIQRTMDWLINSHFFNVRASLNNQFIIDPSKVYVDDADDGGPGFIYRMRPEAYGQDITKFFHQIPVADVTRQHLSDLAEMQTIGERITGINEQMFGGISKSRTTATEVRTSTGFGVNRLKTVTEWISAMGISPLASKMLSNSQQFYDMERKFKVVGDLAQMAGPRFMQVNQNDLSGDFDFVPVDGALPIDRQAMAKLWQEIMSQMRAFPQLLQQFDISKVFTHIAWLGGIRNINQLKVQVVPDAQLAMQAQAGNVVPMRAPGAGIPGAQGMLPSPDSGGGALEGLDAGSGAA